MCNLYRLDKGRDALRRFFNVTRDDSDNQPPLPEIYPDQLAPIVRHAEPRIMEMRRWGMATPPKFLPAGSIDRGVTNPQHGLGTLAGMAETGASVPCPGHGFRRTDRQAQSSDSQEGLVLVCPQ